MPIGILVFAAASWAITQNNTTGLTQNSPSYEDPRPSEAPVTRPIPWPSRTTAPYTHTVTRTVTVTATDLNRRNIVPEPRVNPDGSLDMGTVTGTQTETSTGVGGSVMQTVP